MNELQHEFIRQSVADLNSLVEKSRQQQDGKLPENLLREIFRALHTIKGTSQVFGLSAASRLAHTLENLLAAAKNETISAEELKLLAPDGVEVLASTLSEKNFQIPSLFAEKIQRFQVESSAANAADDYFFELPAEFSGSLSPQEKSSINEMLNGGNNVLVVEIGFAAADFAAEFKNFRGALAEQGEIIASLPSAKFAAENKIGFRFVYATKKPIESVIENSAATIIHRVKAINSHNLPGVLAQIEAHGKNLARRLGKTVEFEISANSANDEPTPTPILKIVFDALLHLVRNAVGHAFDESGKIFIEVKTDLTLNKLILTISDNGKGLNAEKIREKAIEKNIISADRILAADEIINLIFAPDFSTAAEISDVSGRGVGLDAVKTAVENAGGEISVESKPGAGTTFEIFLPMDFSPQKRDDEEKNDGKDKF